MAMESMKDFRDINEKAQEPYGPYFEWETKDFDDDDL